MNPIPNKSVWGRQSWLQPAFSRLRRERFNAAITALLFALTAPLAAATCDSLAALSLPNTSITRTALVPAGEFTQPGAPPPQQQLFKRLPAFCRVASTLSPSSHPE